MSHPCPENDYLAAKTQSWWDKRPVPLAYALAVLIVQGGIALLSSVAGGFFTPAILASISAVGGAMLIALGIDILGIKKLRVGNMLPALLLAILLGHLLG